VNDGEFIDVMTNLTLPRRGFLTQMNRIGSAVAALLEGAIRSGCTQIASENILEAQEQSVSCIAGFSGSVTEYLRQKGWQYDPKTDSFQLLRKPL
jgi:hypothetical protein